MRCLGKTIRWLVMAAVAVAAPGYAAEPGSMAGQALSAVGQPVPNATVELFEAWTGRPLGGVLQSTVTDSGGGWQFTGVQPGDYIVRVTVGQQSVATPVSLAVEQALAGVQVVLPSTATAGAAAAGAGAAGAGAAGAGTAAGVAVGTKIAVGAAVAGAAAATAAIVVVNDAS